MPKRLGNPICLGPPCCVTTLLSSDYNPWMELMRKLNSECESCVIGVFLGVGVAPRGGISELFVKGWFVISASARGWRFRSAPRVRRISYGTGCFNYCFEGRRLHYREGGKRPFSPITSRSFAVKRASRVSRRKLVPIIYTRFAVSEIRLSFFFFINRKLNSECESCVIGVFLGVGVAPRGGISELLVKGWFVISISARGGDFVVHLV
ncbi:hypothetical protein CEXT_228831 [Caerostris extrusa]|uniref:Uncharacterized protein n=1 Tax=Caerostris extrusa TaxID=172846 RepID=A0AAV4NQR2_CAEEX|nr:hypothetical protein CEXT_228831 [Caerostris extrusa]